MPRKTPDADFKIFLAMIFILVIPAVLTLRTVTIPRQFVSPLDSSPYGYTWSLLTFLLPVAFLGWWFIRHPKYQIERKAFYVTIGFFTVAGLILDIGLGNTFFTFPNSGATLGIFLPGYDFTKGWVFDVPIEELGFYLLGSVFMLLFYIWNDLFWFGAYNPEDYADEAKKISKLVMPHWYAALWSLLIIGLAVAYKKFGDHPYNEGFPGYLTVMIIGYLVPTFIFFRTVKPFVNWRAFGFTLYTMWLISLFWEVTMGVPYQWWGYKGEQMLGVFIAGWTNVPIEEPLLWSVAGWGIVLIYEVARIYLYMGRKSRDAFLGVSSDG